jgi:hypothetical protein
MGSIPDPPPLAARGVRFRPGDTRTCVGTRRGALKTRHHIPVVKPDITKHYECFIVGSSPAGGTIKG